MKPGDLLARPERLVNGRHVAAPITS